MTTTSTRLSVSAYQRHLMRVRGFCDGAGLRNVRFADSDYQKGYADGQLSKGHYAQASGKELGVFLREIHPADVGESDICCSACGKLFDVMKAQVGTPVMPNTLSGLPDHNNPWVKCPHCDFVMR